MRVACLEQDEALASRCLKQRPVLFERGFAQLTGSIMDEKEVEELELVELGDATELTKGLMATPISDCLPPPYHGQLPE